MQSFLGNSFIIIFEGEYAERIDNADELLESFLDNFHDENSQVRQILWPTLVIRVLQFFQTYDFLFKKLNYLLYFDWLKASKIQRFQSNFKVITRLRFRGEFSLKEHFVLYVLNM